MRVTYTAGGNGTRIVIGRAAFYQREWDTIYKFAGKPKLRLDGGAYADDPCTVIRADSRNKREREEYARVRAAFERPATDDDLERT